MQASVAAGAMYHSVIYFMKNAGEEQTTGVHSDGPPLIRSRGLKVYVGTEEIEIYQGKWKNSFGSFKTLEDAVNYLLARERCKAP